MNDLLDRASRGMIAGITITGPGMAGKVQDILEVVVGDDQMVMLIPLELIPL